MNRRQRKKNEKKFDSLLAPWEMMKYYPICALRGGEAMKMENREQTRVMHKKLGYPDYPDR